MAEKQLRFPRLREVRTQQIQEWESFLGLPFTYGSGLNLDMHIRVLGGGGLALLGLAKSAVRTLCSQPELAWAAQSILKTLSKGEGELKQFLGFPRWPTAWATLTPRSHDVSIGQITHIGCLLWRFGPGVRTKLYMHRDHRQLPVIQKSQAINKAFLTRLNFSMEKIGHIQGCSRFCYTIISSCPPPIHKLIQR